MSAVAPVCDQIRPLQTVTTDRPGQRARSARNRPGSRFSSPPRQRRRLGAECARLGWLPSHARRRARARSSLDWLAPTPVSWPALQRRFSCTMQQPEETLSSCGASLASRAATSRRAPRYAPPP